ncbi:hypothetical protein G3I01_14905 [Gramella sp. MT6]|uniref:hypothetical protein n=1 Tax=Gramella sp. MT6 TaxID=2705471 RepID=UPI001C603EBC|nr:hypothetical protein [Gramella sp. MT6]QYA26727.1 hypothetical protein G3I01_14905 [Gramella sp. MT6]
MDKTENITNSKFSAEQLKGWEEYRSSIYDQQTKSHDSFEKAMTFITSGALALTLTFHDKIVPVGNAKAIFLIAAGWGLLAITLFVNLVSHYLSSKSLNKSADEIDQVISYDLTFDDFNSNLENRNRNIDRLNKITIWSLGIGLTAIIMYVTINIYNGKKEQSGSEFKTSEQATTQTQKLRTKGTNYTKTRFET